VSGHLAGEPDQAPSVAAAIGFPVTLKIRSHDIAYKSDVGAVALNLADADRVRFEAAAMLERVRAACPESRLDGFLVQPMVWRAGGLELLVGLVGDPVFGPAVAFGQIEPANSRRAQTIWDLGRQI
jgi:acetyltransferase